MITYILKNLDYNPPQEQEDGNFKVIINITVGIDGALDSFTQECRLSVILDKTTTLENAKNQVVQAAITYINDNFNN